MLREEINQGTNCKNKYLNTFLFLWNFIILIIYTNQILLTVKNNEIFITRKRYCSNRCLNDIKNCSFLVTK